MDVQVDAYLVTVSFHKIDIMTRSLLKYELVKIFIDIIKREYSAFLNFIEYWGQCMLYYVP